MTPLSDRPNIILIMVDQWRGDCLSIAGHPVVHTPYLDQLAQRGTRFERAYAACPICIPARASLHTGLEPATHGRVGYSDGVPWDYPITLAGEFTQHGYQTQAVGKMHVFPERSQIGFQNVILHDGFRHGSRQKPQDYGLVDDYVPWLRQQLGREADYFDHGINCNSIVARPWDKAEHLHPTNYVVEQSIDFLRRRDPRKPFFLYMSFHRPHPPYDPPRWAFEQYRHRCMPAPPVGDWVDVFAQYDRTPDPTAHVAHFDRHVLDRARAGYYGHMTHIDHQVNRFLEVLADYDLADNSYICFVADHGEMMGDHNLFRKGYAYEGSARVPLILSGPAESDIVAGNTCRNAVELRDVMPTLLDCAGLPIPDGVQGHSLVPLARSAPTAAPVAWREYLHGECTVLSQSMQWVTDGHEKYIWMSDTGREQLFNLDEDPHELTDLARQPDHADRVQHWRQVLVAELSEREEGFSDGTDLIAGQPVTPVLSHLSRRSA